MKPLQRKNSVHIPVLTAEIMKYARRSAFESDSRLIIDATLGEGGHTIAFRDNFPESIVLACDRDPEMIERAKKHLLNKGINFQEVDRHSFSGSDFSDVMIFEEPFSRFGRLLYDKGIKAAVVLLDLGVSLYHFQEANRGFSYNDENLDMRLDSSLPVNAANLVNTLTEQELIDLLRTYGEEKNARNISRAIINSRPISSARILAEIIRKAGMRGGHLKNKKKGGERRKIHPATRVFQALRIAVNQELSELEEALRFFPQILTPGGIMAVISFHSLEDRLVKQHFRSIGSYPRFISKDIPEYKKKKSSGIRPQFLILTKKPITPDEAEIKKNQSARSAKLRILKKNVEE